MEDKFLFLVFFFMFYLLFKTSKIIFSLNKVYYGDSYAKDLGIQRQRIGRVTRAVQMTVPPQEAGIGEAQRRDILGIYGNIDGEVITLSNWLLNYPLIVFCS